jgi:transglutaminase-like putative cysteine protease
MRLTIRHETVYAYDAPVRFAVQSLRLTPSRFAGQKVAAWSISSPGGVLSAGFVDGAGDRVQTLTHAEPVPEIRILVEGEVETSDISGVLNGHREKIAPGVYLRATPATDTSPAIRALAARAAKGADGAIDLAHRLMAEVAGAVAYRPGSTETATTAAEAVERGAGVCQDHAHVMIAAAREHGIPARYAIGYMLASDGGDMHEASHAWAELHIQGLGWVGFDPANACCPDDRYVRIGSGLNAATAAPVRGISQGLAEARLDVSVSVQSGPQTGPQTQTQQ